MKAEDITEAQVVSEVKEVIKLYRLAIQRINTGTFKGYIKTANAGTLDFEGYDNYGRFIGIECKRPKGGKVSPEQLRRIEDINKKGGHAAIIHSGEEALNFFIDNRCI